MRLFTRMTAFMLFVSASALSLFAQPGGAMQQAAPTVINADGTVTFRYQNRNAK